MAIVKLLKPVILKNRELDLLRIGGVW